MTASDYIFMNEQGATLTVEGGTFTATKATDANGVVIYNQGICNIKNGTFDGPGFTLMNTGSADMTIENGNVINRKLSDGLCADGSWRWYQADCQGGFGSKPSSQSEEPT